MRAGQLREKVTFQRKPIDGVGDGFGNFTGGFANIVGAVNLSADMRPLRGTEVVLAEGVRGLTLYEVELRYTPVVAKIEVGDIMLHPKSGRSMNVKAPPIDPSKRNRRLVILVEYGGASG